MLIRLKDHSHSVHKRRLRWLELLQKKLNLRIAADNNSGRKKDEFSEEVEELMDNFLERLEITHTTPGKRDTVCVEMNDGKWESKRKWYLLWKFRELLEIINGSKIITNDNSPSFTEIEHLLSFCQIYNFFKIHKEVAYNSDIPHSSSLCEVCKNALVERNKINFEVK